MPTRFSISWPNTPRAAQKVCPSLTNKNVSPHVLRHTAAMEMLQAGVDRSMIAIWLGHESIETTKSTWMLILRLRTKSLPKQIQLEALRFVTDPETDYSTSCQVCKKTPNYAASMKAFQRESDARCGVIRHAA